MVTFSYADNSAIHDYGVVYRIAYICNQNIDTKYVLYLYVHNKRMTIVISRAFYYILKMIYKPELTLNSSNVLFGFN